jgi:hypothetical protein
LVIVDKLDETKKLTLSLAETTLLAAIASTLLSVYSSNIPLFFKTLSKQ